MEAMRTLVKSPPELWAEVSDVAALTRHLGEFGEIRITRTEPESVVEWEGDRASGTVRLEPAGWGTRVALTVEPLASNAGVPDAAPHDDAEAPAPDDAADASAPDATADASAPDATAAASAPDATADASSSDAPLDASSPGATPSDEPADPEPARESRRGFFARLFGHLRRRRASAETAEPTEPPEPPVAVTPDPTPPLDPPQAPPVEPPEAPTIDPPEAPTIDPPQAPPLDPPEAPPTDPAIAGVDGAAVLGQALDALGKAHHRPYSR